MTARENDSYNEENDGMRHNRFGLVRLKGRNNSGFVVVTCNDMPVINGQNVHHLDNMPLHKCNGGSSHNSAFTYFY